jgi:GNAT superfamily N-acetyltransferase
LAFELAFRQISEEHLPALPAFACGRESLEEFLVEDSYNFHKYGLTNTTLVFVQGDVAVAGYFSLSSDAVKLATFEEGELGLPFSTEIKYFPAVKITRFAVHTQYQRAGMGMQLIDAIEGLVYSDGNPLPRAF